MPAWPLYFANPELPASAGHIERLSRELRFNVDVSTAWDERYEADDHRDLARLVTCPALIVAGEHDFICGPTWNRALAEAIPSARYVEIPSVGHMPHYEDPESFIAIVGAWLAEEGAIGSQLNSKNETPRIT